MKRLIMDAVRVRLSHSWVEMLEISGLSGHEVDLKMWPEATVSVETRTV